jgi:glycosyltransferase involved in cell wall biosynthesis
MKISVLIPAHNSAKVIGATLDSVLRQTVPPDEIIVMDDGSTDDTLKILLSYQPRVTVLTEKNQGVAAARNALLHRAGGDLIAFLDHDDLWHPDFLSNQCELRARHPRAAAYFMGHIEHHGYGSHEWEAVSAPQTNPSREFSPVEFLFEYNHYPAAFSSMSFCCLPKSTLESAGPKPFCEQVSGVDDFYFFNLLPLIGPVACLDRKLVAYRITSEAQSVNCLLGTQRALAALDLVKDRYLGQKDSELALLFKEVHAAKHRQHAKILFGAGQKSCAKRQVYLSFQRCRSFASVCKSLGLLSAFRLPRALQPKWPPSIRAVE